ncbi:MAG: sugar transferase, partial [Burkholderiales bacterium]|nr:sugar transferase [Anaerolineae bacterium]
MLFSPTVRVRRLQLRISERRLLLMAGDVFAVVLAVVIALRIWAFVAQDPFTVDFVLPQSGWFFVLVAQWLIHAAANDFYELRVAAKRGLTFQRLLVITLQLIVAYVVIFFISQPGTLPRLFILYYGVSSFLLISLWRLANPALVGWVGQPRRVLIVGTDWAAQSVIDAIKRFAPDEYQVEGIIGEVGDVGKVISDVPVIGTGVDLLNFTLRDHVSELVVTSTRELSGETFQGVMDAYERGVAVVPMPLLYERITGRVPVEHVNNNWAVVLPIEGGSVFDPYPVFKRLLDIVLALVGMILFLLALPFIALLIRLDSAGDIFYSQERVGKNGLIFRIYKLRTMVTDAEAKTGAVFAQKNDDRITRVGKFLRKTRLDELPQFYNILKGDMSLIGPRPERPEHVSRLTQKIPFYRTRLILRPGATGWAQVRYGYGANDEDALVKLQYDLYYVRHKSLALDLNIILRTFG